MNDYAQIRDRFHAYAGDDAYPKFIAEINRFNCRANRLRYWQEQIWQPFANGEGLELSLTQILDCFAVCHIHGCDLETDDVKIIYGTTYMDPAELKARQRLFPMAHSVAYAGCCVQSDRNATVQFCPECRLAQKRWDDQDFKHDIETPDSEEIRLFLIAKSSRFNADDPVSGLLRYYKTWKPPRPSHVATLAPFVDLLSDMHRMIIESGPTAETEALLSKTVGVFSLSVTDHSDRVILDHCKMHYIAAREVHRLAATQIATEQTHEREPE